MGLVENNRKAFSHSQTVRTHTVGTLRERTHTAKAILTFSPVSRRVIISTISHLRNNQLSYFTEVSGNGLIC